MRAFMDEDFLLKTNTARELFHNFADYMPIVDYHCHIDPKDIAENTQYDSITQVWLGGDHYKWRLIRADGVPEAEVTGARESDPEGLFLRFAQALQKAIGNPVYHWAHLELKRYFGVEEPLTMDNAKSIYAHCNQLLTRPEMRVRGLIKKSNVRLICTTDDPADDLRWHQSIREDESFRVRVLPAFRPDPALNLEKAGFAAYMDRLGKAAGVSIGSYADLCQALSKRIDFFDSMGCRASDHALAHVVYAAAGPKKLNDIFQKALSGKAPTPLEADQYRTGLLLHLAEEYRVRGWVMQLHFGCMRDNNSPFYKALGPDTGFDAMNGDGRPQNLAPLLDAMQRGGGTPKMVLYSLNPADSEIILSIAGCFMADAQCPGRIQLGAPWWFNDTKAGMEKQLTDYANATLLGNFIGMLTDSRSFLSYTRHEYFRRILCNQLGQWMEDGEYPADVDRVGLLVQNICYNNTVNFFGFPMG